MKRMGHGTNTRGRSLPREICRFGARFLLVLDAHGMHGVKLAAKFVWHVYRKGKVC